MVPDDFNYALNIAKQFPTGDGDSDEISSLCDRLRPDEIKLLCDVYQTIAERGDAGRMSDWLDEESKTPELFENGDGRILLNLFAIFWTLGRRRVRPFSTGAVALETSEPSDWSELPKQLAYFPVLAERYGTASYHIRLESGEASVSQTDLHRLSELSTRLDAQGEGEILRQWLHRQPGNCPAVNKTLRLFNLMEDLQLPSG